MSILSRIGDFMDRHESEIVMAECGIIGLAIGKLLSEPAVSEKVEDWVADKAKKVVRNIHITYGEGRPIQISGGSSTSSSGGSGKPIGYYDWLDRREERQHEERMAEMKYRYSIHDDGSGKVE